MSDQGLTPQTRRMLEVQKAAEGQLARRKAPVKRTSAGLRNALFDEIDAFRAGNGDPERALAVAKIAQNILNTAKLELQYHTAGIPMKEKLKEITLGDVEADDAPS